MSIASLIIALGLLVDDPVVAGDAIKRELAQGKPRSMAAWLGPEKLSKAILYATMTNIAAYLPFLLLKGDVGRYIYSLPVTIACSLVASRVDVDDVPSAAGVLHPEAGDGPADARPRDSSVRQGYSVRSAVAIDHRLEGAGGSSLALAAGAFFATHLHHQFFPRDNFYIAYVDIRLPEDAPIAQTARVAREADQVIREVADAIRPEPHGLRKASLASVTSFVGAGGPRFWFSVPSRAAGARITRSCCCNSLEAKTPIGSWAPLQDALSVARRRRENRRAHGRDRPADDHSGIDAHPG